MEDYNYAPIGLYNWVTDIVAKTSHAQVIKTNNDWKIVEQLFGFWLKRWPSESAEFLKTVPLIRDTRANKKGLSESREIQYTATLPPTFMKLIKIVFPNQQFDKKFIYKLCLKMPIFKISRA